MADIDVDAVLEQLEDAEKIALLAGRDFWHTNPVHRLGVPSLRLSDGPNGVRGTHFFNGEPAACFPCGTALGATWDTELLHRCGDLMAREAKAKGAHVILGPTINMQRSPLGGRGFESISEDPVLAGKGAGALLRGMEENGIAATLKHFVTNDMEHERNLVDAIVSERALREIYLMAFQVAIRECSPSCIMTAYNRLNGTHVSETKRILTDILREEWGWHGLIMSDWYGVYSTAEAINAGLDLEMPGPTVWRGPTLSASLRVQKVRRKTLDERVRNVLRLVKRCSLSGVPEDAPESTVNTPETADLLRKVSADSIVLLKNENNILPLKKNKTLAVIGPNAKTTTYCGGGSASLRAYHAVSPYEGISDAYGKDVKYTVGAYAHKELPILAPQLMTGDGRKGMIFKAYNEPPSDKKRKPFDELYKTDGVWFMVDYFHPEMNVALWYATAEGILTPDTDCEYDFGLSVCGTAKLYVDGELVVDNDTVQRKGSSFFGMGTAEEIGRVKLHGGKAHKIRIDWASRATMKVQSSGVNFPGGGLRIGAVKVMDASEEIQRAIKLAKGVDQVVLCIGLNSDWESEGHDRADMLLPGEQDRLVHAICAANPNTVVVQQSGTPVFMPWAKNAPAILQAWYGGNETGNAIADILFGAVNPSGKLSLSFPIRNEDNPAFLHQSSEAGRTWYGEDIYVGYRYYQKLKKAVLFPFGHGLSYTTFSMDHLKVQMVKENGTGVQPNTIVVRVAVKNTGNIAGAEVVQVYVSPAPTSDCVSRPPRELKGFSKAFLQPAEEQYVEILLERKYATSYWNEREDSWVEEKGKYGVWVGSSSDFDDGRGLIGEFEISKKSTWRGI
ncbi:putative beta-glucosidase I [Rhizodiscina lignyota]|uniref:beta-glucosidase n=1 Tax=Rhizodiscina lignyota TaxID=1504668 RepID=A0A9P4IBA9_9PEZI|nr:putative beta-glucosidase I [Rhizodiscina lignyota]